MRQVKTMFGRVDTIYEYDDFMVGDVVKLLPNRTYGNVPKYLEEYELTVAGKGRKNIKVETKQFPNEYWYVSPCYLKKMERG